MPAVDPPEPNRPSRNPPRKRDPRLDAKPPTPGNPSPRPSRPREVPRPNRDADADLDSKPITAKAPLDRRQIMLISAGVGGGLLLLALVGIGIVLTSGPSAAPALPAVASQSNAASKPDANAPAPNELREPVRPIKCRILTPEAGFVAFVDDQPVRDAQGRIVPTPCEVLLEKGRHVIRVARKGWNDVPRVVDVIAPVDFEQEPTYEPFAETGTTFKAPYLDAPVGQPVPLEKLQFPGRCQDPFVSATGREIWYAASGPEGMGIYYSTRPSPTDEWDTPSLLLLSRGADLPASPSATEDSLLIGYTVPGKVGRVWGLTRKSVEDAFDNKKPQFYAQHGDPEWPSAQLSTDGKRLYWLEVRDGKTTSWMASRYELEVEFNKAKKFPLPGGHPCLSADELRQYAFDGKQLSRARRSQPTEPFSDLAVIAELNLPDYVPHPERRQFWVTDDEQWLYYAQDPATSGKLFVVRLKNGPGRGVLVVGRPLDPKVLAMAKRDETEATEPETKPASPEKTPANADPRSLPTPYAAFQQALLPLLTKRDYAAAAQFVAAQQQAPELTADRELMEWDAAEVAALQSFWTAIEQAAEAYPQGESIRIGGSSFTLEKYENGVFFLKTKTKEVQRKLAEMSAGDLLVLADKVIPKTDPAGQLAIGIFLHLEGKSQAQALKVRFERAGPPAEEFRERLAVRRLKIIERELARENLGVALQQIDELVQAFPDSPSSQAAEQHRAKIYSYVKWEERGTRQWQLGKEDSSYTAMAQKETGSLLVSSASYENFDLSLEWKTISPTGQGGVYFRYPGQGKPLDTAFKVHLANDAGVTPDKFCTGSLFNYYAPTENAARPGGQWNTLSVQVRGEQTLIMVNGKKVIEALAIDPAVPKDGFVALDGEFGGIVYRKILLVEGVKSLQKPR